MNKILLIALIMSLAACGNSQQEQSAVKTTTPTAPQPVNQPTQSTAAQATKSATNPNVVDVQAAMAAQKNRPRVIRSSARPKNEIQQNYPYDISLKTAEGKEIPSDKALATNGKPTVLMFWLTTCTPCRFEMEAIKGKYADWQDQADFNFYAISTDFDRNYDAFVKIVNEKGWEWETYNDVNREFRNVMPGELNGLPQTFVLDAAGKIVYHKRKWRPGDEDVLFDKVKALAKG
ncbi:MAG: TlpA family protein disulfide reductase [Saprospiraceae bacterium]